MLIKFSKHNARGDENRLEGSSQVPTGGYLLTPPVIKAVGYDAAMDKITLTNGIIIERDDDYNFPPLQDIAKIDHACDICPIRVLCDDNNEFDCQVYGMFQGFYMGIDDALRWVKENAKHNKRKQTETAST